MSPKRFYQTVCGEARRLLARLPHLDQSGGGEANDERGERRAEQKEGSPQPGFAGRVHAIASSLMRSRPALVVAGLSEIDEVECESPDCRSSIRGKRMGSCGITSSSSSAKSPSRSGMGETSLVSSSSCGVSVSFVLRFANVASASAR